MTAQLGTTFTLGIETAFTGGPIEQPVVEIILPRYIAIGFKQGYAAGRKDTVQEVKLSTAVNVRVTMQAVDGSGPASGKTLSVSICKSGASSFTGIAPTVTDLGSGVYNIVLTTSHTDTLGALSLLITASFCITETPRLLVIAVDKADAVRMGLSSLPSANAEAAGGLITNGTGTGQLSVSGGTANAQVKGMDTDTVNAAALATDAVTELKTAIDTQLTASHGAGSWLTGGGGGGSCDEAAISQAVVDLLIKTFGVNLPPINRLSQGVSDPTTRTAIRALENALRQLTGQQ